ncbi:MAG: hypothetical protein ACJAXT_000299 [Paracoccaceae bacterium]|jgi:hypothetical protein
MFDRHEMIFSKSILSESFHPGVESLKGMAQEMLVELRALFPELNSQTSRFFRTAYPFLKTQEALAVSLARRHH